jgi:hypothetical protein
MFFVAAAPIFAQQAADNPGVSEPLRYFSLKHLSPAQVDPADAAILRTRNRELMQEAEFYGYDLSAGQWSWDQTICPQLPDSILLHYTSPQPNGGESLFTALIPRNGGRIRIVPVYYHSATPFHAAVKNDRNIAIFNAAVPPDIAEKSASPEGSWLSLAACYVELVGGEPNVPNQPSLVPETMLAPQPTIQINMNDKSRHILFTDRDARNQYLVWSVSLNDKGRVTAAQSQTYHTYAVKILQPPAPQGKVVGNLPEPAPVLQHPAPVPH